MSNSPGKAALISRFVASGIVNGAISFTLIFVLMLLGVSAFESNVLGYAAGLASSFLLNRRFVFVSNGRVNREAVRFLVAFGLSFAANAGMLQLAIALAINAYLAQVIAAATYTIVMFMLCDAYVFAERHRGSR